jgi:hypothetical protein
VTSAAYPTWFALSACCAAASGRMLITSLDNRFTAQAWLSAATFALWSALTTLFFWVMV